MPFEVSRITDICRLSLLSGDLCETPPKVPVAEILNNHS
jgi:hypothetical protein